MDTTVKTMSYSENNMKLLESKGYDKSLVCKPYSKDKALRYSSKRMVYWFSDRCAAHMSECTLTRSRVGTIFYF